MECVPVFPGILFAGLSHQVNEGVLPGGILVRYPRTHNIEIMPGLKFGNVLKYGGELRDLARQGVIHHQLKDAVALCSHRSCVYQVGSKERSTGKGQNRRGAKLPALPVPHRGVSNFGRIFGEVLQVEHRLLMWLGAQI